jgi:CRISPR-associated protein Csd1
MKKLIDTYDNNAHLAGIPFEGKLTLLPLYHITQKAQIEVTIDSDGNFISASKVSKDSSETVIPATEASSGRSSGIAAHPLCDQLQYICLGLEKFLYKDSKIDELKNPGYTLIEDKKLKKEREKEVEKYQSYKEKTEEYMKGLGAWAESEYSHPKVRAVYKYLTNSDLISDLCRSSVINLDESNKLSEDKIEGTPYEKCLVRWIVYAENDTSPKTWEDKNLFDSYINYCNSIKKSSEKAVCYVTGTTTPFATNHPKGIVRATYGAKLISTNDNTNFTFRGRFSKWEEAAIIGLEASQKAHNALSWLVANQGLNMGGRTYVAWNPMGKKIPKPSGIFNDFEDVLNMTTSTMPEYKKTLNDLFEGYRKDLEPHDDVVIMALDAATTGRLSIAYYNELRSSDFIDRIQHWHETCCWFFKWFNKEGVLVENVMSPITSNIIKYSFGNEENEILKVKDEIMKEQSQRIISCIVDKQLIPTDIVRSLFRNASRPQAYDSKKNYSLLLSTACAVIRKYHNDKIGKEIWKMQLDVSNTNRSYLFGRLLAVLEKVERSTYSKDESGREPNATRLQSVFVQRPLNTWGILEKDLVPYYAKLKPGSRKFYKDIIGNIVETLQEGDISQLNKSLDDVYLLGYYLQRKELNQYVKTDDIEKEEE